MDSAQHNHIHKIATETYICYQKTHSPNNIESVCVFLHIAGSKFAKDLKHPTITTLQLTQKHKRAPPRTHLQTCRSPEIDSL